jgi:hypothetical protein
VLVRLRLAKKQYNPYLMVHADVTVGQWGAAFRVSTNAPGAVPLPANHSRGFQRNEFAARGRLAHAPGAVALPIGLQHKGGRMTSSALRHPVSAASHWLLHGGPC